MSDLVSSLTSGKLRFAVADLAELPRAGVVGEDRYSAVFTLDRVRPAVVLDGLAELQVRYPGVPLVFAETRKLAQEWTYRFLAVAAVWLAEESDVTPAPPSPLPAPVAPSHADVVQPAADRCLAGANRTGPGLGPRRRVDGGGSGPAAARGGAGVA